MAMAPALELALVTVEEPAETAEDLVMDAVAFGQENPALLEAGDVALLDLLFEGIQSLFCDALFCGGRSVVFEESIETTALVALPPPPELATAIAEHVGEGSTATVLLPAL